MATAGLAVGRTVGVPTQDDRRSTIVVDPHPVFELSPYLYMAAMNSSSVSRDSVSVGSIIIAPFTTNGK